MKRFLVFEIQPEKGIGGLDDFKKDYDSIDTDRFEQHDSVYQTLDTQTGKRETYFWQGGRWMSQSEIDERVKLAPKTVIDFLRPEQENV